ncbi:MAG: DNA repair protein RecN [Acidimicrobiales bacterium]
MLVELSVRDLGVIEQLSLRLGPGLTALTGETGAGKTLVVEALQLLAGARADPVLVRPGASEAVVEGRFLVPAAGGGGPGEGQGEGQGGELLVARAVAAAGRSRAWVDGRMAPVSLLAEMAAGLVELHGQHAYQVLRSEAAQREALDAFGGIDLGRREQARARLAAAEQGLRRLGGDARERAAEAELLAYQLAEIRTAALHSQSEGDELEAEEDRLARAGEHREAALAALAALAGQDAAGADALGSEVVRSPAGRSGEGRGRPVGRLGWGPPEEVPGSGGAADALAEASGALAGHGPLVGARERVQALAAELADVAGQLRLEVEAMEDDPGRLAEVQARQRLLADLCRKHGGTLAEVMAFGERASARVEELAAADARVTALESERELARESLEAAELALGDARREAAPALGAAVESRLAELAMEGARFVVSLGEERSAESVSFLLGANRGEAALPLAKIASGGELARTMLALRLVLTGAPPTMVFDEVDAGIGGQAAVAVGRALASLSRGRQVLVVTHLAQVAAFADTQLVVRKQERDGRSRSEVTPVEGEERVVELARMLSGRPSSETGQLHAAELLSLAASPPPAGLAW